MNAVMGAFRRDFVYLIEERDHGTRITYPQSSTAPVRAAKLRREALPGAGTWDCGTLFCGVDETCESTTIQSRRRDGEVERKGEGGREEGRH